MPGLFEELKRRNVVRVGVAYVVVAWLILQFTDLVLENIAAPDWIMQVIMMVLAIGLPLALFFAWAFEITPEGIKREKDVDRSASVTQNTGRKIQNITIVLLVMALAFSLSGRFLPDAGPAAKPLVETNRVDQSPKSIAVLPFVDMSADKSYGYFSDGLSEELLNLLAKTPELQVAARTSSFAFKGRNEDVKAIAETLNVETILEGSIRFDGDQIRVTTQLINAADGYHLWSETYDRELTSVFALQDEIAGEIIAALQIELGTSATLSRGRPTENMAAYALYLRAMERMRLGGAGFQDAVRLAGEAIELDPNFAEAYEVSAVAAWSAGGIDWTTKEALVKSKAFAEKALALKPGLLWAETILLGSDPATYDRLAEMEAQERLIAAQPSNSKAKAGIIYNLIFLGYLSEARQLAEDLTQKDPLYPAGHGYLGSVMFAQGEFKSGRREWQVAKDLGFDTYAYYEAIALFRDGETDRAIQTMMTDLRYAEQEPGSLAEIVATIRDEHPSTADIKKMLAEDPIWRDPNEHWYLYAIFGYPDELFDTLIVLGAHGQAQNEAEYPLSDLAIFRPEGFHADPRFIEIAEAYGMADVWRRRGPPDYCRPAGESWECE